MDTPLSFSKQCSWDQQTCLKSSSGLLVLQRNLHLGEFTYLYTIAKKSLVRAWGNIPEDIILNAYGIVGPLVYMRSTGCPCKMTEDINLNVPSTITRSKPAGQQIATLTQSLTLSFYITIVLMTLVYKES